MRTGSFALALAGLSLGALPAAAQQVRTVTLGEATQLATRSQPAMVQAQQDARVADFGEHQALATFLPSLNSTFSSSTSLARKPTSKTLKKGCCA